MEGGGGGGGRVIIERRPSTFYCVLRTRRGDANCRNSLRFNDKRDFLSQPLYISYIRLLDRPGAVLCDTLMCKSHVTLSLRSLLDPHLLPLSQEAIGSHVTYIKNK